jgi:UDP-N-acetylglucosamine 2-epimerase (non-hydrolysing)
VSAAPSPRRRVAALVGTRPEAVKMAPVLRALRGYPEIETTIVASGQHRDLVAPMLAEFGLAADADLAVGRPRQQPAALAARLLGLLDRWLATAQPALVVAQGDTTTVFAAALAAFYRRIPFAHVEAGLRSHDPAQPFPEETHRVLVARLARLHFAPLESNRRLLAAEGVPAEWIHVTGNPGIDALLEIVARQAPPPPLPPAFAGARRLLLTVHRRENFGAPLAAIAAAVRELVDGDTSVAVVVPVHPNPAVGATLRAALGGHPRVALLPPLAFPELVTVLAGSTLVLTDSGGIQEEAPALGVPALVLRERTERPEAVAAGAARLVGADRARIVAAARELLADAELRRRMASCGTLFGDGRSGPRIAARIAEFLATQPRG